MQEVYSLQLKTRQPKPLWASEADVSVQGMLSISTPESDFDDDNPLPYGHSIFVEDNAVLWVCRLWQAGQSVGHALLQWHADLEQLIGVHDWATPNANNEQLAAVLRALLASAPQGLRFIGMSAEHQRCINNLLAPAFFDQHNNAYLHWSEHARTG